MLSRTKSITRENVEKVTHDAAKSTAEKRQFMMGISSSGPSKDESLVNPAISVFKIAVSSQL